jgi:ClpP class serine protease
MSTLQLMLATVLETKWAILPKTLDAVVSIIERDNHTSFGDFHREKKEAYIADLGEPVKNTAFTTINGNTGIITIDGPLVPRAGMMQGFSAPELASYERISSELRLLEENPKIKNILFVFDTPGGAVSGIAELSQQIRNSGKNTQGFVVGMAASAGFWLGSSVKKLYSSITGEVGSIGVVAAMRDTREADAKNGIKTIEIVSSVSPNKRLDPLTDAGRLEIQKVVDALGNIFVDTVATNRSIAREAVISKFGAGGMLVASSALEVGMIDGITTLAKLIHDNNNESATIQSTLTMSEGNMAEDNLKPQAAQTPDKTMTAEEFKQHNPSAYNELLSLGAKQERERIQAIESITHPDAQKLVANARFNPSATKESVALAFAEQLSSNAKAAAEKPGQLAHAARDLAMTAAAVPSGATVNNPSSEDESRTALATAMADGINKGK